MITSLKYARRLPRPLERLLCFFGLHRWIVIQSLDDRLQSILFGGELSGRWQEVCSRRGCSKTRPVPLTKTLRKGNQLS